MCHVCLQNAAEFWERQEATLPGVVPVHTGKTVWSTSQVIDQLQTPYKVNGNTIEFAFPTDGSFFPLGEADGHSPLNAYQQTQARLIYSLWDDLIAPDFVETSNPNTADLTISNTTTNISYAHAWYPTGGSVSGDAWLNTTANSLQNPTTGSYGFMAIAHEIGHTLGLEHAGNYNGGSPNYANDASHAQDSHMYTIMSYFNASNTGADWYANGRFHYAQTPMLHDVLAIQAVYGADATTRTGDTVYGFNSNTNSPIFDFAQNANPVLTIWDAGGNDTLDLSGFSTSAMINLAPGSYSDAGAMTNNIAIAYGAWIENAVGGSGADAITGNDLNNNLNGGEGNDTLDGGAGNDILYGRDGDDDLDAGAGVVSAWQYLFGGGGDDIYRYSKEDAWVFINAGAGYEGSADGSNDRVIFDDLNFADFTFSFYDYGTASNGVSLRMNWDDGTNSGELRIGHEGQYIEEFQFADGTLINNIGQSIVSGVTLVGTPNNDTLNGGEGNDTLDGGAGNDILYGRDGDDDLDAGAGVVSAWQYLFGGGGDDIYRYSKEDAWVFINAGAGYEGSADGSNDRVIFDDLNFADFTFSFYDYGTASNGVSLRMNWDDGTNSGELRIGHEGQYIEEFQFADGTLINNIGQSIVSGVTLVGTPNNDTLNGGEGNDTLDGGAGNDILYGRDGDDDLDAGAGVVSAWQYLFGGGGDDIYRYSKEDAWVFINAGAGYEGSADGSNDRVIFDDLNFADFTFSFYDYGTASNGVSLRMNWDDGTNSGELRIGHEGQYIEEFQFADGSVMTWDDFLT